MNDQQPNVEVEAASREEVRQGLGMVSAADAEALAKEKAYLRELDGKPLLSRLGGYFSLSGPGWLQSALTLGGGSAGSSLFAGALLGYSLLWLQPVAMIAGIIMMAALAHQTLSTELRPFQAVNKFAGSFFGWGWALASLMASIIWSLPQFNLAGSVIGMIMTGGEGEPGGLAVAVGRFFSNKEAPIDQAAAGYNILAAPIIAALTLYITWNYSKGRRGIRWFENMLKLLVAGIVICFAIVAFKTKTDWGNVAAGFLSFKIPDDAKGFDVLISAFATAIGINMTFLFPYTLLARGWGREHRGLVKFDLGVGMLVPFVIATGFVIISASNVLHQPYQQELAKIESNASLTAAHQADDIKKGDVQHLTATTMAKTLEPFLGKRLGPLVFGLGIIGMTISTIVMLMLVSGFICTEICNAEPNGTAHKVGILLPVLGVLGPILWGDLAFYLVVPTSVICFFFLPIAYVAFFIMMNKKDYLKEDAPQGASRLRWNLAMGTSIAIVATTAGYEIFMTLKGLF